MPKLSLHWPVDQAGYRIEQSRPVPRWRITRVDEPDKPIKEFAQSGPFVVRNGGTLVYRDPLKIDGLYNRLAECRPTAQGALAFVSRFGFLGHGATQNFEAVEDICNVIRAVVSLRKWKRSHKWQSLHKWFAENRSSIHANPELLAGDPPEPFFRPATLRDAIYFQFLEDLAPGANLRLCKRPGCGDWFKYGPGTIHRSTAQYCSPKCQNAHKYQLRKEAES